MSVKVRTRYARIVAAIAAAMDRDLPLDYGTHSSAGGFKFDRNSVQLVYDIAPSKLFSCYEEIILLALPDNTLTTAKTIVGLCEIDSIAMTCAVESDIAIQVFDSAGNKFAHGRFEGAVCATYYFSKVANISDHTSVLAVTADKLGLIFLDGCVIKVSQDNIGDTAEDVNVHIAYKAPVKSYVAD